VLCPLLFLNVDVLNPYYLLKKSQPPLQESMATKRIPSCRARDMLVKYQKIIIKPQIKIQIQISKSQTISNTKLVKFKTGFRFCSLPF
jgi:hypothetical protein